MTSLLFANNVDKVRERRLSLGWAFFLYVN
nr:MAG TPA: hypothetical protein [Caudoviricetes sp.]